MADADKKTLERLGRLFVALRENQAKEYELLEEMQALLNGHAGVGDTLKQLYAAFDVAWCARYSPGEQNRYVWVYARDTPGLKRLLKSLPVEEIERRMLAYLRNDDPYYVRARHPFPVFLASINSHTAPAARPRPAPWSCEHTPKCPHRTACAIVSQRKQPSV